MKIGIDARFYGPKEGGGGLGRYVKELLDHLQVVDTKNHYVVFLNQEGYDAFSPTNPHFEKRLAPVRWYTFREQIEMPRIIDREKLDLMHYPHWNVPVMSKTPFVVTIHDLILLSQPSSAHRATKLPPAVYKLKHLGYRIALRRALSKSRHVIAVSEFVKDDILEHFPKMNRDKITVVYEGTTKVREHDERQSPFRPDSPYLLYVGNAFPHKNLESLLHGFSLFHKLHKEAKLVLVGKTDFFYERLHKEVKEIDLPEDSVIFTGFVPDAELSDLYRHATLYVFPSRHEGFGLPPLEAMAHGVPVAASRASSLPEILGDAALYFDPDDLEEMVTVMETALSDEVLRSELGELGKKHQSQYSWKSMANEIANIYQNVT